MQTQKCSEALSEAENQFSKSCNSQDQLEQEFVQKKVFEDQIEFLQQHLDGIMNSISSVIIGLNHRFESH